MNKNYTDGMGIFLNELNVIYNEECVSGMSNHISDESIDMVVTSPPYDSARTYKGYDFIAENVVKELYRVIKPGGVVVWVVGDATIKGSETGTSFQQALLFMNEGFRLHDTMIYQKQNPMPQFKSKRFTNAFEYMFVFSKDAPATFNGIFEETIHKDLNYSSSSYRQTDGSKKKRKEGNTKPKKEKLKSNIWSYKVGTPSTKDKIAFEHPAIFPEKLAEDHILSWSNPGDIVLDPFMGSGTTAKMAILNNRHYIGFEISEEYCGIAEERLNTYKLINT